MQEKAATADKKNDRPLRAFKSRRDQLELTVRNACMQMILCALVMNATSDLNLVLESI